jgi:hypothetical protein
MPDGRQFLFQAPDSRELNEWMSRINYASAFKSAGVCIRALGMSSKDVELTGVAAATSHLHDIQNRCQLPTVRNWDGDAPNDLMEMLSGSSPERPTVARRATMLTDMESEVIVAPTVEGADEFKATFDQVKADLAAGYWFSEISPSLEVQNRTDSPESIATPTFGSSDSDRSGLPSRTQIIQAKVNDLETKIAVAESQLESELRFVRNIATLTPFQRSTRDRLQNAVQNVAGKIMQVRIEVTKLICHRDVLSNDLAAEGRNWHRKKQLALRAATETLRIPQMTLSFHKGNDERRILSRRPVTEDTEDVSNRPESSVAESFHSALDFGPEWPTSPEAMGSSNFLSASGLCESPTRRSSGSSSSFPFPDVDTRATSSMPARRRGVESSRIGDGRPGHERFYTAQEGSEEQAEDWNKTRCAHRVSLVRLPSNFRLSSFIEKHARYEIGDQQGPSKDIVPIS